MAAELAAEGISCDDVLTSAARLRADLDVMTASPAMFARYERWLGLPDFLSYNQQTLAQRRLSAAARLCGYAGSLNIAYLQQAITDSGYAAEIEETETPYVLRVTLPGYRTQNVFEVGVGCAGDPLIDYVQDAIEPFLRKIIPAHCRCELVYTAEYAWIDALHQLLHVTYPGWFGGWNEAY